MSTNNLTGSAAAPPSVYEHNTLRAGLIDAKSGLQYAAEVLRAHGLADAAANVRDYSEVAEAALAGPEAFMALHRQRERQTGSVAA